MKIKTKLVMLAIIALCSCEQSKKEAQTINIKIICDSVKESYFDASGNETITTKYKCDTIKKSTFDALGNGTITTKYRCDTIKESTFDASGN